MGWRESRALVSRALLRPRLPQDSTGSCRRNGKPSGALEGRRLCSGAARSGRACAVQRGVIAVGGGQGPQEKGAWGNPCPKKHPQEAQPADTRLHWKNAGCSPPRGHHEASRAPAQGRPRDLQDTACFRREYLGMLKPRRRQKQKYQWLQRLQPCSYRKHKRS